MRSFYGRSDKNTESQNDRYLKINNCGFFEEISDAGVLRENGRVDYQLIYVKSGELYVRSEGGEISLSSGAVYLFRPNTPQEYYVKNEKTTYFWIHFTGKEAENMLSFFEKDSYQLDTLPEFESFCKAFYRSYRIKERFNELYYEGQLISLFGTLCEKIENAESGNANKLTIIQNAIAYLESEENTLINNDVLAKECCISKNYLIKTFKSVTGTTPQKYRILLQIDKSKQLLRETNLSVSEISRLAGIADPLYFSRLFKKETGLSPSEYRMKKSL
jgi:AraC-like DNA-binding protein